MAGPAAAGELPPRSVRVTPAAGGGEPRRDRGAPRRGRSSASRSRLRSSTARASRRSCVGTTRPAAHRFEVDLPAGLKSVEIDPRERLVETALGSLRPSDDPRYDNRRPPRWRLLYEGFGALLNITALTANFEAAFLLKPQHDLRHAFLLTAYHNEKTDIGVGGAYYWNFGGQADKNTLDSYLLGGLNFVAHQPQLRARRRRHAEPGFQSPGALGPGARHARFPLRPLARGGRQPGRRLRAHARSTTASGCRRSASPPGRCASSSSPPGTCSASTSARRPPSATSASRVQLTDAGGQGGLRGYAPGVLLGARERHRQRPVSRRLRLGPRLEPAALHHGARIRRDAVRRRRRRQQLRRLPLLDRERLLRRRLQLPGPARRLRRLPAAALDRSGDSAQPPPPVRQLPLGATSPAVPMAPGSRAAAPAVRDFTVLVTFFPSF